MLKRVVDQGLNLKLAGCLAVVLHVSLFYIEINRVPANTPKNELISLSVVIQEVRDEKIPKKTLKDKPQTTQTSDLEPKEIKKSTDPKEQSVVVLQPSEEKEYPIHVPSIHSNVFKNFLKLENESLLQANPEQLDVFNQSFEPPTSGYPAEKTNLRTLLRHLNRVGVAMTEDEKGRRTCYGVIHNMLDITAAPSVLSRDCTPPKKFELNMNKPNNG